jgi:hypothetical protein
MKRHYMVILKVNLDKCFPVVIAIMYFDMIKEITIKLQIFCNP